MIKSITYDDELRDLCKAQVQKKLDEAIKRRNIFEPVDLGTAADKAQRAAGKALTQFRESEKSLTKVNDSIKKLKDDLDKLEKEKITAAAEVETKRRALDDANAEYDQIRVTLGSKSSSQGNVVLNALQQLNAALAKVDPGPHEENN